MSARQQWKGVVQTSACAQQLTLHHAGRPWSEWYGGRTDGSHREIPGKAVVSKSAVQNLVYDPKGWWQRPEVDRSSGKGQREAFFECTMLYILLMLIMHDAYQ